MSSLSVSSRVPVHVLSGVSSRLLLRLPDIRFGPVLTLEEISKLAQASSLTDAEARSFVDELTAKLRDAVFHLKSRSDLEAALRDGGMETNAATAVAEAWVKGAPGVIQKMKKESGVDGQFRLEKVNWEMGVTLSSSSRDRMKDLTGLLQLTLLDASNQDSKNLLLEFNHEELYRFYEKLEAIQEKMDALGK